MDKIYIYSIYLSNLPVVFNIIGFNFLISFKNIIFLLKPEVVTKGNQMILNSCLWSTCSPPIEVFEFMILEWCGGSFVIELTIFLVFCLGLVRVIILDSWTHVIDPKLLSFYFGPTIKRLEVSSFLSMNWDETFFEYYLC